MTEGAAPADRVRTSAWVRTRLLGALAAVVAAVLAIVGSFQALVTGELTLQGRSAMTVTITGWELAAHAPAGQTTPLATVGGAAQNGIPLTVAACLLVVAALLAVVAAPRVAIAGAGRVAVVAGATAAAFLTGIVVTVAVQVANLSHTFRPTGTAAANPGYAASAGPGAGFWLELVAAVLAIAAAVLVTLPGRRDRAEPYEFPPPPPESEAREAGPQASADTA